MCCFSRAVRSVSSTQIFARRIDDVRQALVYSMKVTLDEPLAMVLPLPVVPRSGDDAVTFVDLSGYPKFFEDLDNAFPRPPVSRGFGGLRPAAMPEQAKLVVHDVGDFVASYVPSPKDFARLDERFRLPDGVFAAHAEYVDYGFAVFQLKPRRMGVDATASPPKKKWWQFGKAALPPPNSKDDDGHTIHPMAFTFPSRRPAALYFPTLHVHDGSDVPATARFDHMLFCQSDDRVLTETFAWRASDKELRKSVDPKRAKDLVDGDALAYRCQIVGEQPNVDHWFAAPACKPESLWITGEKFSCKLAALSAYHTVVSDEAARKKTATALHRLDELSTKLAAGLEQLIAERGDEWHLGRLRDNVRDVSLSNWEPHEFTQTGFEKIAEGSAGPFKIQIPADGVAVERQNVTFVFDKAPGKATVLAMVKAIGEVLDRAIQ